MEILNAPTELWEVIQTEEDKSNASVMMLSLSIFKRSRLTKNTTDNKKSLEETKED